MPFALIIIGVVLLVAGVRNTASDSATGTGLYSLLKNDLTGSGNFPHWMIAILIIGSLGYVDELKTLSRSFLVLVVIILFVSHGGFFKQFNDEFFATKGA